MIETIAIDIGNITTIVETKKESDIFESRILDFDNNDRIENDVLEIRNEKVFIGRGSFENDIFKFEKENYIKLLHYSIAKYSKSNEVNLVVGLPAGQYNNFKNMLKEIILKNSNIEVYINNDFKRITIKDVLVVPEGYGIYKLCDKSKLVPGAKTLVIDIGGGTTDIAEFNQQGKFEDGKSIPYGLLDMYRDVLSKLSNNGINTLEEAKEYFDGDLTLLGVKEDIKTNPRNKLFRKIVNDLKGLYPQIKNYNLILCGGGAKVLKHEFKNQFTQTIVEEDIKLNAKGYFAIGVKKFG